MEEKLCDPGQNRASQLEQGMDPYLMEMLPENPGS